MKVKALIDFLQSHHSPDDTIAVSLWTADDVLGRAQETGIVLTPEQAATVLDEAEHRHDAEVGINWDVLDFYIETVQSPC